MDLTPRQVITDPEVLDTFRRIAAEEGANAARRYALRVEEEDGAPYHPRPRVLRVANGALTVNADGTVSLASGGGSLTVEEADASPSVNDVTTIVVPNDSLTDNGSGQVTLAFGGGGGDFGVWSPDAPPASAGAIDDEFDGAEGAGAPTGWTEVDHGSASTINEAEHGLELTQSTAGPTQAGVYKAIPAGDFTVWTKVSLLAAQLSDANTSLALMQDATSSTGDMYILSVFADTNGLGIGLFHWTAHATFGSTVKNLTSAGIVFAGPFYLRIRRTSTTYGFDVSGDGAGWLRIHSSTVPFTPSHFGLLMANNTAVTTRSVFQFFRYVASDVGITGVVGGDRVSLARA